MKNQSMGKHKLTETQSTGNRLSRLLCQILFIRAKEKYADISFFAKQTRIFKETESSGPSYQANRVPKYRIMSCCLFPFCADSEINSARKRLAHFFVPSFFLSSFLLFLLYLFFLLSFPPFFLSFFSARSC